jgi:hypothetical protein
MVNIDCNFLQQLANVDIAAIASIVVGKLRAGLLKCRKEVAICAFPIIGVPSYKQQNYVKKQQR